MERFHDEGRSEAAVLKSLNKTRSNIFYGGLEGGRIPRKGEARRTAGPRKSRSG